MRAPTREQKAKEAAFLYAGLADLAVLALQVVFAFATLSLTLIGEVVRAGLLLFVDFYTFFILRAVHRNQLRKFRFGIGKVEQMCSLAIAAAIVFGGLWVANRVVDVLLFGQAAATPLGLAMAAVVSAINTLINFLGWYAMVVAASGDDSAIYEAQVRSRAVGLISSLVVQTTLTVAVLTKDPVVAVWLDGLGAAFVAWLMVTIGCKMMVQCIPDLLDHSVPAETRQKIDDVLRSAGIDLQELIRIRTRRSGSLSHVELTLAFAGCLSLAEFRDRAHQIEQLLVSHVQDADVTVLVDVGER